MSNFWQQHTQAMPSAEPELPGGYAAWQRSKPTNGASGSAIYSEQYQAAINGQRSVRRPSLYSDSKPYGGLESYAGQQADPLAARPGESPEAHRRRVLSVGRHLDESELQARLAEIGADVASHEQLRAQLAARTTGEGIGVLGATPQKRAALVGRFGGRAIAGQGHITAEPIAANAPLSGAEVGEIIRQREAEQRNQPPAHTDVSSLQSSGTGIFVR